jgi:hypothetical protein
MPRSLAASFLLALLATAAVHAQTGKDLYTRVKGFTLGSTAQVSGLVLKRDRLEMTFNGTFYLASPVAGKVTGAVFVGQGQFRAQTPPSDFEKGNLKRLLGVEDAVESDFKTAILRFSDDTGDIIGAGAVNGAPPGDIQRLAYELDPRFLEVTGANLSARLAMSILNREQPGVFFGMFDDGKRGQFYGLLDHQNRLPTHFFGLDAGEKGLVFKYNSATYGNDVWLAFYSLADYQKGAVDYSDMHDVIDVRSYKIDLDLTEPKKRLGVTSTVGASVLKDGVSVVNFTLGEGLGEFENERLKKNLAVRSVKVDGRDLEFVQEEWEGGFTVFLGAEAKAGTTLSFRIETDGDFLVQPEIFGNAVSYPRSTSDWTPRHGYLDRATYDMTFRHPKNLKVTSVGSRLSEGASEDKDIFVTRYEMKHPIAFATFALGSFRRHNEVVKWEKGGKPVPLEFNSVEGIDIQEDLMMAEMSNSVRYFHQLFGDYPYETFGATFHPYPFGQGFASMLLLPRTNYANKETFAFIAHETAHQWWGNIVAWRSYRDQWLSEGFAEYSGVVYTGLRKNPGAAKDLVEVMRRSLREPPQTLTGTGKGKLYEVGPLILGHRLATRKTMQAYSGLVYNKGGLVLRMLHFLFTDPGTGDGQRFYDMMSDFVRRYRNSTASTDDFRMVANQHFARTPIAARYKINNLDWFFQQWVYQAVLPSYRLEYGLEDQPDGGCVVSGTVFQEDAPANWFMPLPIVFKMGKDQVAQGTVAAYGARAPFKIKLPRRPEGVELDPNRWILSEKTSTK